MHTARSSLVVLASAIVVSGAAWGQPRLVIAASPGLPAVYEYASIDTLPTNDAASMALSPDGRQLAFVAPDEGRNRLWIQDLASGNARVLPGTNEVRWPFWSPDSQHLGFFGNDKVMRIAVASGEQQELVASATWSAGGSWGPDGTILYGRHGAMTILSVTADGGNQRSATGGLPAGQLAHFQPHFLPDGEHFLYYVEGSPDVRGVYVGAINNAAQSPIGPVDPRTREQPLRLVDADAGGVYAMGRLFFVQGGTLKAQPFDPVTRILSGEPELIAEDIAVGGRHGVALQSNGNRVIYRTGPAGSTQQLTWFDRSGNRLGTVGEAFPGGAGAMSISPDGSRAVVNRYVNAIGEIFTVDLATGEATQVSNFPANNSYPIWSFDGQSVVFSSNVTVGYQVYRRLPGANSADLVFRDSGWRHPMHWSRDGRYLVYRMNGPDLWVLDTTTLEQIAVIPPGSSRVHWPQISPDGRWFAYQSPTSGTTEVYLHGPLDPPSLGQRSRPLSIGEGGWVRWRADGRELFYVAPDGTLMAVALAFSADGSSFTASAPARLFTTPMAMGPINTSLAQQYMPDASGVRFLVLAATPAESPVHVLAPGP
jgi:Tol biopolymer transport system component